jgi:hypothetical protein
MNLNFVFNLIKMHLAISVLLWTKERTKMSVLYDFLWISCKLSAQNTCKCTYAGRQNPDDSQHNFPFHSSMFISNITATKLQSMRSLHVNRHSRSQLAAQFMYCATSYNFRMSLTYTKLFICGIMPGGMTPLTTQTFLVWVWNSELCYLPSMCWLQCINLTGL